MAEKKSPKKYGGWPRSGIDQYWYLVLVSAVLGALKHFLEPQKIGTPKKVSDDKKV